MRRQFHDRNEAGELLAHRLKNETTRFDLVVALPRGGVEVAFPIARELEIPLDLLIVKKLGAPGQPELAIGAIASGGYAYINYEICRTLDISPREVAGIRYLASKALVAREDKLLNDRMRQTWSGKNILLVDDGIATGATIEVAIRAIKAQRPKSLAVAVPVASLSAIERLHRRIDHIYSLHTPSILGAVGEFYEEFEQVTEEQVVMMIDQIGRREHGLATRR